MGRLGIILVILVLVVGIAAYTLLGSKESSKEGGGQESVPVATNQETSSSQSLVNGKTLEERLNEAYSMLHTENSEQQIRDDFPDIQLTYTDYAKDRPYYPRNILPFEYYYSPEADTTFNICAIHKTVFICKGKINTLVTDAEIESGECVVTSAYQKK